MRNKKGLSDIIATVLIVLLALAAVAIIWGFLRKPLSETGTSVELESQCFLVEVKPTGCTVLDPTTNESTNVIVQLLKGEVYELRATVTDSAGTTVANSTSATGLEQLATKTITLDTTNLDGDIPQWVVEAAAVVSDETGENTLVCQVSLETIGCT